MIIAGRSYGQLPRAAAALGRARALGVQRVTPALPTARQAAPSRSRGALRALDAPAPVALGLLALALSAFIPGAHFELQTTSDQVAVETAATLIAAIAAVLFCERFWTRLRLRSLLLAGGLTVIALSSLGAGLLLAGNLLIAGHSAAWVVVGGRLAGWTLIAASAVVPERRLRRPSAAMLRKPLAAVAGCVGVVAVVVALTARTTSAEMLQSGPLGDPAAMLAAEICLALLAAVAAVAFQREAGAAGRGGGAQARIAPARLLALACAFAAASALAACATPSFYIAHVGIADVLRLGWLATLFACVCVEWSLDERDASARALAHERKRMAADVHDLIMQDLSFVLANARTLAADPARGESVSTIVTAGERALAGARNVLGGLTEEPSQSIASVVEASVRTAARHTPVTFRTAGDPAAAQPDEPTRDALVHIAREAVTNAVKHARPGAIEVLFEHEDEWRLTVRDDGRGFDAGAGREGFGLASMRDRAELLGGALRVHSTALAGTTVEASLP